MKAKNNKLPILDEPINYIESISDIDSKKY
jgi:hypothetical protein